MVAGLLMFGIAGAAFAGEPWFAFAVGAFLMVAFRIPEQVQTMKRYAGQPSTDIVLAMMLEAALNIAGAFAAAWAGYGLRLLLMLFSRSR